MHHNRYGIPSSINVGGHELTIIIGDNDKYMNGANAAGELDFQNGVINILGGMSEAITKQVLAHEVLHAFFATVRNGILDDEDEEKLIKTLDNVFYRFLFDNRLEFFKNDNSKDLLKMKQGIFQNYQ